MVALSSWIEPEESAVADARPRLGELDPPRKTASGDFFRDTPDRVGEVSPQVVERVGERRPAGHDSRLAAYGGYRGRKSGGLLGGIAGTIGGYYMGAGLAGGSLKAAASRVADAAVASAAMGEAVRAVDRNVRGFGKWFGRAANAMVVFSFAHDQFSRYREAQERLKSNGTAKGGSNNLEAGGSRNLTEGEIDLAKSVFGDEFLMPGIYDFYYLHGTDWVMSAKRLEGVSPDIHDEVIANSLAQANSLMVSALPMNRQGWLGVMQRLRLFPRLLFSTLFRLVGLLLTMSATILTAVILTAAILAGLYPLPALPSLELIRTDFNAALDIIWNSLAFLILIAFIVGIVWSLLRLFSNTALLWIAFLVGRVETEEGLLRREIDEMPRTRRQRGFRHHYYLLGKAAFRVSDEAYEALTVEEQFRAYYLPARILPTQGRPYYILVNLEPLQESEREIILA